MLKKPELCRGCTLFGDGHGFTNNEGSGSLPLLVIAEAPGEHEVDEMLPLRWSGRSGAVFRRALKELGIPSSALIITNVLRCRPPDNELRGAPYEREAIAHCSQYLRHTIATTKPHAILALGDVPLREVETQRIGSNTVVRGFILPSIYGVPVIASYHPSFIARGAWQLYGTFKRDVALAAQIARSGPPILLETHYELHPTIDRVREFLAHVLAHPALPLSYDVETAHIIGEPEPVDWRLKRIIQIQFSIRPGQAIVMPWDGNYVRLAKAILAGPNPKWGWNSRLSDDLVLRANGCVLGGELHDLMNCLRGDTRIRLWDGTTKLIREIVEQKLPATLTGMDESGLQIPVKVIGWHHKRTKRFVNLRWVKISADVNRYSVYATPDHRIWTKVGWKEAKDVVVGDWVPTATRGADDVLEGMLLGDSHYSVPVRRITTAHSTRQREYATALAAYLGVPLHEAPNSSNVSKRIVHFGITASMRWRTRFYPIDNMKRFTPPSTARSLAIWYMDDGSFDAYEGKLAVKQTKVSYTHYQGDGAALLCLSPEFMGQANEIIQWFKDMGYGDQIAIQRPKSNRGGVLYIKRNTRDRFFAAIAPYIHPSMQYKMPKRYHGQYNGWMERPEPQWGRVKAVVTGTGGRGGFSADQYCVSVDHPTHRFFAIGGLVANCWGHLQPSFWGNKEDKDTDKGVPSRLMGLQSATSFYSPETGPWKHLGDREHLQLYGAYDADYTLRTGMGIMASLEAQGLMAGYRSHKLDLRPVLDLLGDTGLPVDRERQRELREYVTGELKATQERLQRLVPANLLTLHPKGGWAGNPASLATVDGETVKLKDAIAAYNYHTDPPYVVLGDPAKAATRKSKAAEGYLVQRRFGEAGTRWCLEKLYNPHGSSPNTKAYIRHRGYRMPTAIDSGLDTTGKLELQRLAEETGDEVLKLTGAWREMAKVGRDYTGGAWIPGDDGRVHAEFRFGTASAQLVAVNPPVMTFPEHSGIAKKAKAAIRAQSGRVLAKIDMRGFHARMAGWLANDADYYRLADFDVHSYVTAHFLHLPEAEYLSELDDDELASVLETIKDAHKSVRNYKVKRVVHGVTFGMRARKLYRMYSQNFENEAEAQSLISLLGTLFPRTFTVLPSIIEDRIRNVTRCRLVSPFGHHRYFYDYDMQQATAFLPSNASHCHVQAALVRMHAAGTLQRYEACNFTHDAVWFHPLENDVDACIAWATAELEAPSTILTDGPLGPFFCHTDAEVGHDLSHMDVYTLKGAITA